MSTLLLGANGQLGFRLREVLGDACVALDRAACDFSTLTAPQLRAILDTHEPKYLINAVAYTAVDAAETEREIATRINATMPALLAEECSIRGIRLVHFSTDYVFDGLRGAPYAEDAKPNPRNHYGASKLAGEQAVLKQGGTVFRLQWLYDVRGKNFFLTIRRLLAEQKTLRVVADQIGAPSFAPHVARAVLQALEKNIPPGLYHLPAGGHTSWHGVAVAIVGAGAMHIIPVTTAEYGAPAARPLDARLNGNALASYGVAMPHWRDGLNEALGNA